MCIRDSTSSVFGAFSRTVRSTSARDSIPAFTAHSTSSSTTRSYLSLIHISYVIFMQVLTSKEENGVQVADRIHVTLLSTDTTKSPIERMKKQSDKNGLWSALEIGTIWLEKSLLDAKKEEKK